jgi:hypothetical protein
MLAVAAAILSALGVLLNWPQFSDRLFQEFTSDLSGGIIAFWPGYDCTAGKVVLFVAFLMAITLFIRPSPKLIKFRSFTLGLMATYLLLASIQALRMHCPFYSYAGLLFSFILQFVAFIASTMRIGAVALMAGGLQPPVDGGNSLLLKSVFSGSAPGSQAKKLYVTSLDDLHERWPKGITRAFAKREITIGRDGQWADVHVGDAWGAVSNRHGKARVIGNSVFYEPIANRYAFALDGSPCQKAKEMRQGATLNLVSGLGPHLKLELKEGGQDGDSIPMVDRKIEIMEDNAQLMSVTLRNILILALLSLALFGAFLLAQRHPTKESVSCFDNSPAGEARLAPVSISLAIN